MTTSPCPTITPRPTTTPTTATTAPAEMDHRPMNLIDLVGPPIPCHQLKTAKVTQVTNDHITIGYDEQHWSTTLGTSCRPLPYAVEVLEGDAGGGEEHGVQSFESAFQLPPDTPIESVDPLEDAGFHILTKILDQTFDWRPMTYCRGMGNARRWESEASSSSQSKGEVKALMQEVTSQRIELASYKTQMSLIV
ncbi:hypothetical protein D8674_017330 [Pyrus ussuriensis x Pyrus communis]|uniref:Uncharacterized protein n=1 Tax=Pyrus ussuriensis x Pyrus communis TaxID=2448454 RepID=A0A5N5HJJ2_9ROSA|nr:hypothetical protein D8674_017330 [Pyrus ussuriensis x Pyrus communis]